MDKESKIIKQTTLFMMNSSPFYGTCLIWGDPRFDVQVSTAHTDGRRVTVGRLPVEHREFLGTVLAHEALHMVLGHLPRFKRMQGRYPWPVMNLAADVICQGFLARDKFPIPPEGHPLRAAADGIDPARWPELGLKSVHDLAFRFSFEEICALLYAEYERERDKARGEAKCWLERQTSGDQDQGPGQGQGFDDTISRMARDRRFAEELIDILDQGAVGEEDPERMEADARSALVRALTQAKLQGKLPAGHERLAELAEPRVDWRRELWALLQPVIHDFEPWDRRLIHAGLYDYQIGGKGLKIGFAADTSGSMGDREIGAALTEVLAILRAYPAAQGLAYWVDAEAYGPYELREFLALRPQGGGGTDFRPFFERMKGETVDVVIYVTDGYGTFPEPSEVAQQTIWVVTPGGLDSAQFPFGRVIRLESV